MKVSFIVTPVLLAALSLAAPLESRQAGGDGNQFRVDDGDESSPYNGLAISANGNRFWLGKPTKTFCPTGQTCPGSGNTVFHTLTGSPGSMHLNSKVPAGGQTVYVAKNGALKFLDPKGTLSNGTHPNGFSIDDNGAIQFSTAKHPNAGFYACDSGDGQIFSVFVGTATLDPVACDSINLVSSDSSVGYGAYRYV